MNDPVNFLDPFGLDACTWDPTTNTLNCTIDTGGGGVGGGGGSGPGRPTPAPMDPPPLTVSQEKAFISSLALAVKNGKNGETDCNALADYIDAVADQLPGGSSGAQQLKGAISLLTPNQFPVPLIPGVVGNSHYVPLNGGSSTSGFQTRYQDEIANADQAHHFAAFFQLGYVWGASVGANAASWWEKLEGTPGNTGDINLGTVAAQMGAYVASGVLPVGQVGSTIRDTLCK